MQFDTIAAIATPMGEGGIGIIRVSGSTKSLLWIKFIKVKVDYPQWIVIRYTTVI